MHSRCTVCGSDKDLWICLICGNVGCGRYTSEHAQEHYLETQHNFAMALNDNRVWDYHGDYFVHRLIQNESSRKIIGSDENWTPLGMKFCKETYLFHPNKKPKITVKIQKKRLRSS